MANQMPTKIKFLLSLLITLIIIFGLFLVNQKSEKNGHSLIVSENKIVYKDYYNDDALTEYDDLIALLPVEDVLPPPPPPEMKKMKTNGCVVDGILNGKTSGTSGLLKLVNRSNCYYLHRSIETWLQVPDFDEIEKNIKEIKKENVVYGMFIAEAIDVKSEYYYKIGDREFDFSRMCRSGSKNDWGEHTCKPSLAKKEYQRYVLDITRKAMDLGVQSFMFGQVFYQDYISDPSINIVLEKMRKYAQLKGMEIVIGAQTNDIEDEKYLSQFDFIEGGVGLKSDGSIENGPCFSRWYKKEGDWCWALLWHDKFKNKAKNVFTHLDWSGKKGDDMSTFALMSNEKRADTLHFLDDYFTKRDVGFLMPMLAVLHKDNGGCHGKSSKFYSADNRYSCKDEDTINELLGK